MEPISVYFYKGYFISTLAGYGRVRTYRIWRIQNREVHKMIDYSINDDGKSLKKTIDEGEVNQDYTLY